MTEQRCEVAADGDAKWYASVTRSAGRTDYRIVSTGTRAADGFGESASSASDAPGAVAPAGSAGPAGPIESVGPSRVRRTG